MVITIYHPEVAAHACGTLCHACTRARACTARTCVRKYVVCDTQHASLAESSCRTGRTGRTRITLFTGHTGRRGGGGIVAICRARVRGINLARAREPDLATQIVASSNNYCTRKYARRRARANLIASQKPAGRRREITEC